MGLKKTKSFVTFYILSFIGLFIAISATYLLPEKYFWDSDIILNNRYNLSGLIGSYQFSIWFYDITKLKYLPIEIVGLIQYIIVTLILFIIGVPRRFYKLNNLRNLLIYSMMLLLAVYIAVPAKEFINFIYISIIVFLIQNRSLKYAKTIAFCLFLMMFFGFFFRPYYYLICILSVLIYLGSYIRIKNYKIISIVYGLLILIGISLSYGIVKGEFISQTTREALNTTRMGSEAAKTMIVSPLDADTWYGESFGIVYGFFSVNVPLNGLKHMLSPQVLIFILWQLLLFYLLIRKYGKCLKELRKRNYDLWLFYFLFSYLIVQGVFEPDLGSAIRHKIGILPLIYYVLNYEHFRKKI